MLARSKRLLRRFKKSEYATDIRLVATSAIFSQALLLACTPILTRLYTPSDFGVLAVFISIVGVVQVVACFRYDIAISLSKDRQESFHTLALCLIGSLLCTVLVGAVFASGALGTSNSGLGQIQRFGWLVIVGTFAVGVFMALNAWVGYAQKFALIAKMKVRQALSSAVAQVGFGFLTVGPMGLLVGYIISQSYGASAFAVEVKRARPQRFGLRDVFAVAAKYRQFLFFAFPAAVINRLGIHIVPVLFGHYYSIAGAGFFLLAQRLVALPTLVVGRSVAQVYTNRLAKDSLAGDTRLLPTYAKTILSLLALGALPLGLLGAFSPWLFGLVFGDEWRLAGVFCQILTPAFYAQFVVSPMIQTLNVLGYQKAQLIWDSFRLAALVAVFIVSNMYGMSDLFAVIAISATLTATYVLQFLLSMWAIRRHDNRFQAS